MKKQFVNILKEGDYVNDYFVATRKDLRNKQDGSKFLGMVFKDRTGDIGGVMWNNAAEVHQTFEVGDVVNVRAKVNNYQSRLQLQVEQVLPLKDEEYDTNDLVAVNESQGEDTERLKAILDTIENPWLKKLYQAFWKDEAFMEGFCKAAAGKKWHHEYQGGLVRHCYEMARIAETMCELYPELDRDLLLIGVYLHDIGKIYELSQGLYVDYTNEGKLLGHLHIGAEMVEQKIRAIDGFPNTLRMHVIHHVLSHHGELVNGSPVVPKTLEAIVLHLVDNLDAQAAAFTRIIAETRDQKSDWSEFQNLIQRVIWTGGNKEA